MALSTVIPDALSDDDPLAIAAAHVRWCQRDGQSPAMIFAALGVRYVPKPWEPPWPSWDDAVWIVAEAWQAMPAYTPAVAKRPAYITVDEQLALPLQLARAA